MHEKRVFISILGLPYSIHPIYSVENQYSEAVHKLSQVANTATHCIFKTVTFIGGVRVCKLIKSNSSCETALTQTNVVLLALCVEGYS